MKRLRLSLIWITAMTLAVLAFGASAQASPTPSPGGPMCAIDDNGNCLPSGGGCDPYGSTPDCYLDDYAMDAWVDVYYGYDAYGVGSTCFNVHARRGGTWWKVYYNRNHVCVRNGMVTDPGGPSFDVGSGLPYPANYFYGPHVSWHDLYTAPTPTGYMVTSVSFDFQWCNAIVGWPCSLTVHGYIYIDVAGWGGVYCYSDKGSIPNCRGRNY